MYKMFLFENEELNQLFAVPETSSERALLASPFFYSRLIGEISPDTAVTSGIPVYGPAGEGVLALQQIRWFFQRGRGA